MLSWSLQSSAEIRQYIKTVKYRVCRLVIEVRELKQGKECWGCWEGILFLSVAEKGSLLKGLLSRINEQTTWTWMSE